MPIDTAAAIAELREVLEEATAALNDTVRGNALDELLAAQSDRSPDKASEAIALCRSAIERYTPEDSPYRRQVQVLTKQGASIGTAQKMTGALAALSAISKRGGCGHLRRLSTPTSPATISTRPRACCEPA